MLARINPCLAPEFDGRIYKAPEVFRNNRGEFISLLKLDMDAVEDQDIALLKMLCDRFIKEADPCIANRFIREDTQPAHLGFGTYRAAKARWKTLM